MELIHQEQEKRSPHKYIPISPLYHPLLKESSSPVPPWLHLLQLLDHDMHFQLPHRTDLPSWTSRARVHLALLVASRPARLDLRIIALLCHFE